MMVLGLFNHHVWNLRADAFPRPPESGKPLSDLKTMVDETWPILNTSSL